MLIRTTLGDVDSADLARTVIFEERPNEFVVAVEWRKDSELVRRDCHVILKEASAVADALAAKM